MTTIRDYKNGHWYDRTIDIMPTLLPAEIEAKFIELDEEYSREKYPAEHRNHLGISIIGEECHRKLWNSFRWLKLEQFEGRMRRLFNRGHREEPEFEQFLLWAGVKIRSINPETDKQYVLSSVSGHYGGATDGIGLISWLDDLPVIVEYKTHKDKLFNALKNDGLRKTNPKHWAQMCGYGKDFKVKHGLYGAVNKDTDERIYRFFELDWNHALEMEKKATDIIYAKIPPQKISEQPAYWKCKLCTFNGICHHSEPVEKNCRSCEFAVPVLDGQWGCMKFDQIIPKEFIKIGCNEYVSITSSK